MSTTSLTEAVQRAAPAAMRIATSTEPLGRMQVDCARHGAYMAVGNRFLKLGRDIWSGCSKCQLEGERAARRAEREEAQRQRQERERDRISKAIEYASIPERFRTRTLDNFVARTERHERILKLARGFVADWTDNARAGRWLVFAGEPGAGKSHVALAILQALMPAYVGQYITCLGMIQAVRATWGRASELTEADVLRHFGTTPLLVIDEVGVQYCTEGEHTIIFDVLDRRYREMRPTILLTNDSMDDFRECVGDRLFDRMKENTRWVAFDGGSYRKEARLTSYDGEAGHVE